MSENGTDGAGKVYTAEEVAGLESALKKEREAAAAANKEAKDYRLERDSLVAELATTLGLTDKNVDGIKKAVSDAVTTRQESIKGKETAEMQLIVYKNAPGVDVNKMLDRVSFRDALSALEVKSDANVKALVDATVAGSPELRVGAPARVDVRSSDTVEVPNSDPFRAALKRASTVDVS